MIYKNVNYKRTEGKGCYRHKENTARVVCVYDITFCVADNLIYYSYMDPQFGFDGGCCSTPKDVFLQHFVLMN